MNTCKSPVCGDTTTEVSALIETLLKAGKRLEELTGGEIDTVADREGRTFLLQRAQEHLRQGDAAKQAAIINALPAHIALLDNDGVIVSVNEAWKRFAALNFLQGPAYAIGVNYLETCECAQGDDASGVRAVAEGIRGVLRDGKTSFSIEYPCHSPTEQRWFLMTVTSLGGDLRNGAVVMHLDVTAVREAEEEAQLIVNSSLDAVVAMDATGRVTAWNTQAEKTFGRAHQQAVGQLLTETIIPVRYREAHTRGLRMFLETGEGPILNKRIEISALHQDGHEFPVELTIVPVRHQGTWIFNSFIRDLTEKKRSEAALQRFAAAMDATADAIYLVDRASMSFVHFNEAACRMRSQTREELFALGPAGMLGYSRAELEHIYDDIIASGKPAEPLEIYRKRKDGSEAWVELRRQAQRSADGWLIITMVRDITERKRVAAELLESDRRFSDMMDNIDLLSIVIDPQSRIVYCNDYFLALTGWRHDELLGANFVDLIIPPDLMDEVRDVHLGMVADLPAARHHENEILTRSGERRLIRWNNTMLRSSAGEMIGTASIGEDITEGKRAEEEILRLNADLEHRVKARTVELEAANEELAAFDYSVSHDLKAPIRHVEGYSTILREEYGEKLDARGRDYLQKMQSAGERMGQLVDDLLALSLVSRAQLNRKVINLSALAQLVFDELHTDESGRDIVWVVAPGMSANADRGQLRIVLENLIGNAFKFTAGRIGARIEFGNNAAEGGPVFFLRDNGAGFDATYADKLFAPFQRLHAQSEFSGTGIGLATVRRIITRHGGQVWAEGVVNQGATIHFTLPS